MTPFPTQRVVAKDSADRQSLAGLVRKLDDGWTIKQPVYVMADPAQRDQIVFRMMLWREGRPQVVTVRDDADIRQFLADRRLRQESL